MTERAVDRRSGLIGEWILSKRHPTASRVDIIDISGAPGGGLSAEARGVRAATRFDVQRGAGVVKCRLREGNGRRYRTARERMYYVRQSPHSPIRGPLSAREIREGLSMGAWSIDLLVARAEGVGPNDLTQARWEPLSAVVGTAGFDESAAFSEPAPAAGQIPSAPLAGRYRDAYRTASSLVRVGDAMKYGAVAAGSLAFVAGLVGTGGLGAAALVFGLIAGVAIGVTAFAFGALIAAQGHVLRATLDTAVSTSRFMTNAERAEVLGLPPPSDAVSSRR